jgi:hypothetical protein
MITGLPTRTTCGGTSLTEVVKDFSCAFTCKDHHEDAKTPIATDCNFH